MTTQWGAVQDASPSLMWSRYAAAIGDELLKQTFGSHWPPPGPRFGEGVWCFRDPAANPRPFDPHDHPAGWLSLVRNQFNPRIVHMSRGVWPDQHGRGLGLAMRTFAEAWCREVGAARLHIEILPFNAQHLANVLRDPYWVLYGVQFVPPSFVFAHAVSA